MKFRYKKPIRMVHTITRTFTLGKVKITVDEGSDSSFSIPKHFIQKALDELKEEHCDFGIKTN